MRAAFRELREMEIGEWSVAAIASNDDAQRFYQRFEVLPFTATFIGKVPPAER